MIPSLPTEIIRNIFEFTGEYRFLNNQIVRIIHRDDHRYDILRTIPKKKHVLQSTSIIQVYFSARIEFLRYSLIYTELVINQVHTSTLFFYKMDDRTESSVSTTDVYIFP